MSIPTKSWAKQSAAVMAAAAIALGLAGCSAPPVTTNVTKVVDGLSINVTSDPPEPHTGNNNLEVTIRDAKTGVPVVDANVAGTVVMTAPRLTGVTQTGRSKGNGLYEIPTVYATATTYDISIQIERPGHAAADVNLSLEAAQ